LGHVVGVAEPDGPRGGRAGAKQPEKPEDGDARELSLEIVERRVEGGSGRWLAGRQRGLDLVERPGVVAEGDPFEPRERRFGGLVVSVDRRSFAVPGVLAVAQLDLDYLRDVLRGARDRERLGEVEADDPGGDLDRASLVGWAWTDAAGST
jgi:hypothetical protein